MLIATTPFVAGFRVAETKGQVFGLVVLADELVRDVEHFSPVLPDDELPGLLIAPQAPLNERLEGVSRKRLRDR